MRNFVLTILVVLVIVLTFLVAKQEGTNQTKNLQPKYDSLLREFSRTKLERDYFNHRSDSVDRLNQAIKLELSKTRRELKSIKGRYNSIPVDSLGKLMNRRAGQ